MQEWFFRSLGWTAWRGTASIRKGRSIPRCGFSKVTLDGGKLAGFIANYSVHPVVMAEKTRLYTGDLTGVAANKITQAFPGSVGIFLQGSCGDINPIYAHMPQ